MSHEIIGNEPVLFEPSSLEPIVIFFVQNGTGNEEERVVTLSDWKDSVTSALNGLKKLQRDLGQLKMRTQAMQRVTTTRGKPYSSPEKNQINSQIRKDRKRVKATLGQNRVLRLALAEQGKWLLLSPPEVPLRVRLKIGEQAEVISGNPLTPEEASWRMFVFNESEALWNHPDIEMLKKYFFLRRAARFSTEDEQEIQGKLVDFRNRTTSLIPDELVEVFSRITSYDFKGPLLPGLETLQKDN